MRWLIAGSIPIIFVASLFLFFHASSSTNINPPAIRDGELLIHRHRISLESLKIDEAREINLNFDRSYWPVAREKGNEVGDQRRGWFKLASGNRAYFATRSNKRIIFLPTTEGYDLLFTTEDNDKFIQYIRSNLDEDRSLPEGVPK